MYGLARFIIVTLWQFSLILLRQQISKSLFYYQLKPPKRRMPQQLDKQPIQPQLVQLCLKWFKSAKKTRKQVDWSFFYHQLTAFLLYDVDSSQLLVTPDLIHESAQLLLNSLVCLQKQAEQIFAECLGLELLILLKGTLQIDERAAVLVGPASLFGLTVSRNEKTQFRVKTDCIILKGQRKAFQKFRNDILRIDRESKESFITKHLFCGLTPVYPMSAIRLNKLKEATQVKLDDPAILMLQSGLIGRKPKKNGEGTQLTSGSIINARHLAKILQMAQTYQLTEQFCETIEESIIIRFQIEELLRILKLNPSLKKILESKLKTIFEQRQALALKSIQIQQTFNDTSKFECSTIRKHYAIEFRSRPKTAAVSRSFRRKRQTQNSDDRIGDFITFDRYDKMLKSKQKVAVTKACFQHQTRGRAVITFDHERKMKMQNKMMKIQSGKIKRLGQRESAVDISHLKEKLFQVTHLFDQPLEPVGTQAKEAVQRRPNNNRRTSGIKPEEYLKEEYLTAFLNQHHSDSKLKDCQKISRQIKTATNFLALDKQNKIIVSRFGKTDDCFSVKRKAALRVRANDTIS